MGYCKVPYEKKIKAVELYKDGMGVNEIAATLNMPQSTVSWHIAPYRKQGKERITPTRCPECHGTISPTLKVQFCYHCGADLRSEGAKLVPRVKDVINRVSTCYPANLRDEAIQTLNKVIDILKGA